MGYFPHVLAARGDLSFVRHDGNGRDSANVLANLDAWLQRFPDAETVHMNCGLHDLKRDRVLVQPELGASPVRLSN